jgi:hypothetical protein
MDLCVGGSCPASDSSRLEERARDSAARPSDCIRHDRIAILAVNKKQYESIEVPIPRSKRVGKIVFGAIYCGAGALSITVAAIGIAKLDHDAIGPLVFGIVLLSLGAWYLVRAIRQTKEPQLTESGKAAKARDEAAEKEKAARRDAAFMGLVFWVAVVCLFIYGIGEVIDTLQSRIKVYPLDCVNWSEQTDSCEPNGWRVGNVTTYTVNIDQQLVIGITENSPRPVRLLNCVVADRRNWSCSGTSEGNPAHFTMRDGTFSVDSGADFYPSHTRYLSRLK